MTAFPVAHQPRGACRAAAAVLALAVLAAGAVATPAAAQEIAGAAADRTLIDVPVDEARILRLNRAPRSVIIGNPLIADAVVENNGVIILIGKNYGTTNLIALDENGNELADVDLAVRTSGIAALSLFRGTGRVSYNCAPRCESELDVGDSIAQFEAINTQISNKSALSQGQASEGQ